jgi:hypothetical protein
MKTTIAVLALLLLAPGPVFAQGYYLTQPGYGPPFGYYGGSRNSPALTGGGSIGHNRLQQVL